MLEIAINSIEAEHLILIMQVVEPNKTNKDVQEVLDKRLMWEFNIFKTKMLKL